MRDPISRLISFKPSSNWLIRESAMELLLLLVSRLELAELDFGGCCLCDSCCCCCGGVFCCLLGCCEDLATFLVAADGGGGGEILMAFSMLEMRWFIRSEER